MATGVVRFILRVAMSDLEAVIIRLIMFVSANTVPLTPAKTIASLSLYLTDMVMF